MVSISIPVSHVSRHTRKDTVTRIGWSRDDRPPTATQKTRRKGGTSVNPATRHRHTARGEQRAHTTTSSELHCCLVDRETEVYSFAFYCHGSLLFIHMSFYRLILTGCLASIACVSVASAPYLLIRNKAAKCFKLEHIKPETTLKISYHAPGELFSSIRSCATLRIFVCHSSNLLFRPNHG